MHAAALIEQIKLREPKASFAGFGGDQMSAAGCRLYRHIRNLAFMGFVEVFRHRKEIKDNFRIAREAMLAEQPDVLILIDYPSFNLKMAEFSRRYLPQTRIIYYVPPKIWAWKSWRVHKIARLCDEVLGIFPFEPAFYAQYGYRCTYVGNPTAERIRRVQMPSGRPSADRVQTIAILPGSRKSEVSHCLPRMLTAARQFSNYAIVVTAAPGLDDSFYTPYLSEGETLTRDTYGAVQQAKAAIVNSGTATLETALLKCPQVAVYHLMPAFIYPFIRWAQPLMFSISHFTLVNIIAGKEVIKECIANDFTVEKVSRELKRILTDEAYTQNMLASYEHIRSLLGDQSAAATAASIITSKP